MNPTFNPNTENNTPIIPKISYIGKNANKSCFHITKIRALLISIKIIGSNVEGTPPYLFFQVLKCPK